MKRRRLPSPGARPCNQQHPWASSCFASRSQPRSWQPGPALQALKPRSISSRRPSDRRRAALLDDLGAASQIDHSCWVALGTLAVDTPTPLRVRPVPEGPDQRAPTRLAPGCTALASLTPGNEPNALARARRHCRRPDQTTNRRASAGEAGQALELSEPDRRGALRPGCSTIPRLDAAATGRLSLGWCATSRAADREAIAAWDGLARAQGRSEP